MIAKKSITQILREINFGEFRSAKSAVLTHSETLFLCFWMMKFTKLTKLRATKFAQSSFRTSRSSEIDFTWKILKFPQFFLSLFDNLSQCKILNCETLQTLQVVKFNRDCNYQMTENIYHFACLLWFCFFKKKKKIRIFCEKLKSICDLSFDLRALLFIVNFQLWLQITYLKINNISKRSWLSPSAW